MNLVARQRTDLSAGNLRDRNRRTVERGEFNHEAFAALADMDDGAHVTRPQSVLRQVRGQRHAVQFSNHASKGYAVMKRGASSLLSINQIVRTRGWRPDGVVIPPSTM